MSLLTTFPEGTRVRVVGAEAQVEGEDEDALARANSHVGREGTWEPLTEIEIVMLQAPENTGYVHFDDGTGFAYVASELEAV